MRIAKLLSMLLVLGGLGCESTKSRVVTPPKLDLPSSEPVHLRSQITARETPPPLAG